MAVAIEPGDAYQLLLLFASHDLAKKLTDRVVAETARLAVEPADTPAGRQLAALNRLTEQLLPLGFTDQASALLYAEPSTRDPGDTSLRDRHATPDGAVAPAVGSDTSPSAGAERHVHYPGPTHRQCEDCQTALAAAQQILDERRAGASA